MYVITLSIINNLIDVYDFVRYIKITVNVCNYIKYNK